MSLLLLLLLASTASADVRLGAELVLPGDVDGDGRDDLAYTCGSDVCVRTAAGVVRFPSRLSPTDPRVASVLPAGDVDGDGRAELWLDGALRGLDGPPLATLSHPPAAGGFDADADGHDDLLFALPGRVVLRFGPFAGEVDVEGPGAVVYESGADLAAPRAWWLPDLLAPGEGAVATQCARNDGVSTCPSGLRTLWWPVGRPGDRLGPADVAGGLPDGAPGGTWLFAAGDLDGDGRADVLADDGRGDWARLVGGRIAGRAGPGGAVASADLRGDDRAELVVSAPHGATIRGADGCVRLDAGFPADRVAAGRLDRRPAVVVAGRGARWAIEVFTGPELEEVTSCGR